MENNKEDERKEQPTTNFKHKFQKHWQVALKILELLICGACLGFIYEPANTTSFGKDHLHHTGVMYTAYTGYMLINVLLLISRAIQDRISYRTSTLFSLCGVGLFITTGILLTIDRATLSKNHFFHPNTYRLTMMTTAIILTFANAAVFTLDALFTNAKKQDF